MRRFQTRRWGECYGSPRPMQPPRVSLPEALTEEHGCGLESPGPPGGRGHRWGAGYRADLSGVVLLGVLQSEFMDAMEMMDICR